MEFKNVRVHDTAMIEEGVQIGEGSSVWDNVHIRHHATIGEECIIGGKSLIAYEVAIGNRVKINSSVYICYGVTIEDGVMISAGTIFTNDRFPRATTPDLKQLRSSDPDEETFFTRVCAGATIGAGCIIGSDLTIGHWAMIGMGSVVTKDVPDFHLALGSPCRSVGVVCKCGQLVGRFNDMDLIENALLSCFHCGLEYDVAADLTVKAVEQISPVDSVREPNVS